MEQNKNNQFLYHWVPKEVVGDKLHSLYKMKDPEKHEDINPELYSKLKEIYAEASKKYISENEDRQKVPDEIIPKLECKWGDVLQFSAVHPEQIKAAFTNAGLLWTEKKFYQIDPKILDPKKTQVYLYKDKNGQKKYSDYDPENLKELSELSQYTREYYRKNGEDGTKPLVFVGVPHIMHNGSLDVSDISKIPVITVSSNEEDLKNRK